MLHHKKLLFVLVILNIVLLGIWLKGAKESKIQQPSQFPEIQQLQGKNLSFDQLKKYFTNLAEKKGAKYAFEILKTAPLPPNTDLHLLGHVVGDVLYKQKGAEGIQICTQDFRNACSHSIVVGLFSDKGESALTDIEKACQKAPGGLGAYIMCYHGLGHGILAYEGYDLPKTIEMCKKTSTTKHNNNEYPECVSGALMETISGGGHDHEIWVKQRPKYLKADNPFYICSSPLMPKEAQDRCYDYITPYLWEVVGANLANPTDEDFKKAFELCNQVTEENYRNICFGGFGKEFVGLAASRDIRRVDQMDDSQFRKVVDWCNLGSNSKAITSCLDSALSSIYWGGENDYHASIRFCSLIPDIDQQKGCFFNLISQVSSYIKDPKYKESFCKEIPVRFTQECKRLLLSSHYDTIQLYG